MYPAVRELRQELGHRVVFIVADVATANGQQLMHQHNVRAIPTFMFVSPTGRTEHAVGSRSTADLRRFIERNLPAVPVTGVSVSPTSLAIVAGETRQLQASVAPANATNQSVTWSSGNPAVATVSATGLVTGVSGGTTTVTATAVDGGRTAVSTITVTVPVTGVTLTPQTAILRVGGTVQLTAGVTPSNATNQAINWGSGNPAVATVSATGLVTGVAEGVATVTATAAEGNFAATTAITVDATRPDIAATYPATTTEASVTLRITASDNTAVAGLTLDGALLPISIGPSVTAQHTVTLRQGINIFTITATDTAENTATRTITIERREAPPVTHTIVIGQANPSIGLTVPATVHSGRLMVPFRWFGEHILGATVGFRVEGTREIVSLGRGDIAVELVLNSRAARVSGRDVSLDVAPLVVSGRTLVPARFLGETFGYLVEWNPTTNAVTFTLRR